MARINHADFATVQLKNGLPYFSYDLGRGDTSTMIPTKINDGQWHKVIVPGCQQCPTRGYWGATISVPLVPGLFCSADTDSGATEMWQGLKIQQAPYTTAQPRKMGSDLDRFIVEHLCASSWYHKIPSLLYSCGSQISVHKLGPGNWRHSQYAKYYHLEREMATQSSILAWKIPWTEEPGGL